MDAPKHREPPPPAEDDGRDVGLELGGDHLRARVLPLEPVVLPEVPGERPGSSNHGARRLVSQGSGRPRARAGAGPGSGVLALRHTGDQARPGAVVLQDDELRRRVPELPRDRLPRSDHDDADELDRPVGRRGASLPGGIRRSDLGRPGDPRVHHASRHALRCHLHGPRARAPAGRGADASVSEGRGCGLPIRVATEVRD